MFMGMPEGKDLEVDLLAAVEVDLLVAAAEDLLEVAGEEPLAAADLLGPVHPEVVVG